MDTKLTDREKRELQGLQAREQLAIKPVMDDVTLFWRDVETRLELPSGAMGTSHRFDPQTLAVVPVEGAKPAADAPTDKPKPKGKGGRPRKVKPAEAAMTPQEQIDEEVVEARREVRRLQAKVNGDGAELAGAAATRE